MNISEVTVNMLTDLMNESLECLISHMTHDIAQCFFHHIFQVLVHLESQISFLIYQDVKSANILFKLLSDENYLFQLDDFSLCNNAMNAVTCCGTIIFAAPKVFTRATQTVKMDIWSLFVMMIYVWNVNDFRMKN